LPDALIIPLRLFCRDTLRQTATAEMEKQSACRNYALARDFVAPRERAMKPLKMSDLRETPQGLRGL